MGQATEITWVMISQYVVSICTFALEDGNVWGEPGKCNVQN